MLVFLILFYQIKIIYLTPEIFYFNFCPDFMLSHVIIHFLFGWLLKLRRFTSIQKIYFRISFVHFDARVRYVKRFDQLQKDWPDSIMLRDGQGTQSSVTRLSCPCDKTLLEKKFTVITPNSRHL